MCYDNLYQLPTAHSALRDSHTPSWLNTSEGGLPGRAVISIALQVRCLSPPAAEQRRSKQLDWRQLILVEESEALTVSENGSVAVALKLSTCVFFAS